MSKRKEPFIKRLFCINERPNSSLNVYNTPTANVKDCDNVTHIM
jgi:hypothetical protein